MPCAFDTGDELYRVAGSADEEMGGNFKVRYFRVVRMTRWIETIKKQIFDRVSAEFAGRKTDRMYDEKLDASSSGTVVAIRRRHERNVRGQTVCTNLWRGGESVSSLRQARL